MSGRTASLATGLFPRRPLTRMRHSLLEHVLLRCRGENEGTSKCRNPFVGIPFLVETADVNPGWLLVERGTIPLPDCKLFGQSTEVRHPKMGGSLNGRVFLLVSLKPNQNVGSLKRAYNQKA